MKKYSNEIDKFLMGFILPKMGLSEYNEENIDDIVDFISSEYETPLAIAEDSGDILTDDGKELLELSTKAVTEITSSKKW